jgi:small-conductance mechanosensitive channel
MFLFAVPAFAQIAAPDVQPPQVSAPPATLVYGNRPITELRATIVGRTPADRVAAAQSTLKAIVAGEPSDPVVARIVEGVTVVAIGNRNAFVILQGDVDEFAGETLEQKTALAVSRLQRAVDEEIELRTPARLAWSAAESIVATIVFAALLWMLRRSHRVLAVRLPEGAEQRLQRLSRNHPEIVRASKAPEIVRGAVTFAAFLIGVFLAYSWLTFVLRRFPYTRPWGESLREFLLSELGAMSLAVVRSIPDLFTVLVIVLVTRSVSRLVYLLFEAAQHERMTLPGIHPETAQPTRRIVTTLLWLFALVVSYPYLPGSDSDAFKGVSVFLGLIVSLGSSGVVSQMMSGLTLIYSRAVRLGDFVRIGDVEGTIAHLGSLSTKIKTEQREDVTIPNSVVVSSPIVNYSRFADVEGVLCPTSVTIGYAVPWRQVHALLLLAAQRTPGLKDAPAPVVRQTDLGEFCVKYTLLVCVKEARRRVAALGVLRANIQDVFNEFGVQIMSPNYEADPSEPKVVPREKWYAAPASPSQPASVETFVEETVAETR